METFKGTKIVNGIAIGKIKIYRAPVYEISEELVSDIAAEIERYNKARAKVQEDQLALCEKEKAAGHEETAGIFDAHAAMLDDDDVIDEACKEILSEGHTAEYAVSEGCKAAEEMFLNMEDEYFRARSADVVDLKNSMLDVLFGADTSSLQGTEPAILVAEDLAPSETVKLDKSLLLGLVTRLGSSNSHTAILARSMNWPTLIQCHDIADDWDGKFAILDGYNSCIYIDPDQKTIDELSAKQAEDKAREEKLK
ncbi:MAG: phosphoenolpyruvate--protein phosphotransferase, partial [Synergistaceae bacterium]|nr:phosphoenolpyruvate--protein phosphotransferase [Synergistaceae bacterium]